jgi:hypothetical protein
MSRWEFELGRPTAEWLVRQVRSRCQRFANGGVPDVSEDAEFKVVELLVDGGADAMTKALQEAADDGFEWVHAIDRSGSSLRL